MHLQTLRRTILATSIALATSLVHATPFTAPTTVAGLPGFGLYDPLSSQFQLRPVQSSGAPEQAIPFGPPGSGWLPLMGDWNGNGQRTPGLYDPAQGLFHLRDTQNSGTATHTLRYGPVGEGWLPLRGDWNGNGQESLGLYNPHNGHFYLRNTLTAGVADQIPGFTHYSPDLLPLSGDWNGDGRTNVALYNPRNSTFRLRYDESEQVIRFGPQSSGWLPVSGDWNGDGRESIGLFNPHNNTFHLRDSNTPGPAERIVQLQGPGSALPLVGHFTAHPQLEVIGHYQSGIFNQSAAEIIGYDVDSKRAFVINAASGEVDVLDLRDPAQPTLLFTINISDLGADANSVNVRQGLVAIAVEAHVRTDNGVVALYDVEGNRLNVLPAGALPDALTFSPDGRYLLVANEGEPNDAYTIDPEGSITLIDLRDGPQAATVRTADFHAYIGREDELRAQGVRIFGPHANAAQDLEPEWVEISADSTTAYVSLQENNAIAVVDIASATVTAVWPLGFKDWSIHGPWAGKGFDASDRDGMINLQNWPVVGVFQPDTIRLYERNGEHYIITANEGDSRDYSGWSEEFRVKHLQLDPIAFPDAERLQQDDHLGRLRVTSTLGVSNGCNPSDPEIDIRIACVYDTLYAFGGRSMSIFRVTSDGLELVFDSGSQMEETTAALFPDDFNANNRANASFDTRSDDKGPEPEGIAIGEIDGRTYAFIGLERIGGVMMYEITDPAATTFVQYINNRDFSLPNTDEALTTTDSGAEGLHFIPAHQSPDPAGRPLLLVGNEVSGTTTVFALNKAQ